MDSLALSVILLTFIVVALIAFRLLYDHSQAFFLLCLVVESAWKDRWETPKSPRRVGAAAR